jgi:hypothetical protein
LSGDLVWSIHLAPGGVRLGPGRSQEVRASPELQKGGLRGLGEALTTSSRLRHFLVKPGCFLRPLVISKCLRLEAGGRWRQREVQGKTELQNGGLRALGKAWRTSCRLRHLRFCGRMELVERGVALSREFHGGAGNASAPERWPESSGCWVLADGCWCLAAGCWLLAAGCWLLAAGCSLLGWLLPPAACY